MSISQEELFKLALGLEESWYIEAIDLKVEEKQLDLHIDFETGSMFPCPIWSKSGCKVHDTIEGTRHHLNFFQFKAYLNCSVQHTKCNKYGAKGQSILGILDQMSQESSTAPFGILKYKSVNWNMLRFVFCGKASTAF